MSGDPAAKPSPSMSRWPPRTELLRQRTASLATKPVLTLDGSSGYTTVPGMCFACLRTWIAVVKPRTDRNVRAV
jgi:hypothetical protein